MKSEPFEDIEGDEDGLSDFDISDNKQKEESIPINSNDESLVKPKALGNAVLNSLNTQDIEKKVLLTNLILKCRIEMENNILQTPLTDYIGRIENYTGLLKTDIQKFISGEMHDINLDNRYFELEIRIHVLKWLSSMYCKKQFPTVQNMYDTMTSLTRSLLNFNFNQFRYMINCLGLENRLTNTGHEMLVEDPEITFERSHYFKKLFFFTSNNVPIYYIDEVFVDDTYTFPKPWVENIDVSCNDCDGYVFFHAVSENGFLSGLFCSPTTQSDFTKWVAHIVIPQLKVPSVIVIDQSHLHRSKNYTITKYHSKQDMINYLQQNNIPCEKNFDKADLYRLIKDCTQNTASYDIDELLKAHGHQVLWLPKTFHDLSLTYFLWKYILNTKRNLITKAPLQNLKNVLLRTLMNLDKVLWRKFSDCLKSLEKDLYEHHSQATKALEENYSFVSRNSKE